MKINNEDKARALRENVTKNGLTQVNVNAICTHMIELSKQLDQVARNLTDVEAEINAKKHNKNYRSEK